MSETARPEVIHQLLRHESFVRGILRSLLREEHRVQDLLQETWLRALRRPPASGGDSRAWLARVARNLAISSWRSEARRAQLERAVDPEEFVASAAESQERIADR